MRGCVRIREYESAQGGFNKKRERENKIQSPYAGNRKADRSFNRALPRETTADA